MAKSPPRARLPFLSDLVLPVRFEGQLCLRSIKQASFCEARKFESQQLWSVVLQNPKARKAEQASSSRSLLKSRFLSRSLHLSSWKSVHTWWCIRTLVASIDLVQSKYGWPYAIQSLVKPRRRNTTRTLHSASLCVLRMFLSELHYPFRVSQPATFSFPLDSSSRALLPRPKLEIMRGNLEN